MRYEFKIGLRYLRSRRRQVVVSLIALISMAGVGVGVAALIVVLSGMAGVQDFMRDRILNFQAHLTVKAVGEDARADKAGKTATRPMTLKEAEALREKVKQTHGVVGASPYLEDKAVLKSRGRNAYAVVRGIDLATVGEVMALSEHLVNGSVLELAPDPGSTADSAPSLAVGDELGRELGLYHGSDVSVIVAQKGSALGISTGALRFRVGCVFRFGYSKLDSTMALIELHRAMEIFGRGDAVDGLEVKTQDIDTVDRVAAAMRPALGGDYLAIPWYREKQNQQLFAALEMEEFLSLIMLSLIILVAVMNIVSALLMVVMEKYSDIAILKSMGATDRSVMLIFIAQGTLIGAAGALAGTVLGLGLVLLQIHYPIIVLSQEVFEFGAVPMRLSFGTIAPVPAGAILLTFLTTLYPSWSAARMKPAESLRYE